MFYKAMVMVLLLYRSESWTITPLAMKCMEGFHIQATYRMATENKLHQKPYGL